MTAQWIVLSLVGILVWSGAAAAQVTPNAGAFEKLSPGNQKIVEGLYQAQQPPPGTVPLTRNEIAAAKLEGGKGWGVLFKDWKAQGYFKEKNLGEVVRSSDHPPAPSKSAATTITTASGKTHPAGGQGAVGSVPQGSSPGKSGSAHGKAFGRGDDAGAGLGQSGGNAGHGKALGRSK